MKTVLCMAAPNGARRDKTDHPQLPLNPTELATTAAAVSSAGAGALHLHVRDEQGRHTLSAARYREALAAVRDLCGDRILVQVTTEAAGRFGVAQQIEMVYELKPDAVSLSVREMGRATPQEISKLDRWMRDERVLPQWIIYNVKDLAQYHAWLEEGVLCGTAYPLLFVLGSHSGDSPAKASVLQSAWDQLETASSWMVCAFGPQEQEIVARATGLGGHARVGFENNIWRPDGTLARDNVELVASTAGAIKALGFQPATARQARQVLTPQW